jgi:hypothetical protein
MHTLVMYHKTNSVDLNLIEDIFKIELMCHRKFVTFFQTADTWTHDIQSNGYVQATRSLGKFRTWRIEQTGLPDHDHGILMTG